MFDLRRREFITLLGGAAVSWPLAARAQHSDRMRRVGILMTIAANDPEAQARIVMFAQSLQALGWTDGRNARIDIRWATARVDTLKYAAELAALPSDVILAEGTEAVGPLQAATRSIPIVFVLVPDPVGQGFVDSLARPGGNVTGFTLYEFGMGGKWLQLLKEIVPRVIRAAVIRDSTTTGGVGQFAAIQSMAPSLGVEAITPQGRCHCHGGYRSPRSQACNVYHPYRLRACSRPAWRRPRHESGAAGRQRHRHVRSAAGCCWQADRAPARAHTRVPPLGGPQQSRLCRLGGGDPRG